MTEQDVSDMSENAKDFFFFFFCFRLPFDLRLVLYPMLSLTRHLVAPARAAALTQAARQASSGWEGLTPPPPATKFNEFGLPDQYEAGYWNEENASVRHYFEYDPSATYPGEKELPLQWILEDEAMGPDIDSEVDPYYALGSILVAFTGLAGLYTAANFLAPECPAAPRDIPFDNLSVEYGQKAK